MILKKLLSLFNSKKISEFSRKNKEIRDIVIYGSIVKGKEKINDIDIAILLKETKNTDFKLTLAQAFRRIFLLPEKELDVKAIDESDLKDPAFSARQAILAEGYSLLKKKFLHELYGFKTFVVFSYSLNGLTTSRKKLLYYALNGRNDNKGLLKEKNSLSLGDTIIKVPLENSEGFKELLLYHKCEYKTWVSVEYVY